MKRILVLCTGNRCRSQIAQGILQSLDTQLEVHSAGIKPASEEFRRVRDEIKRKMQEFYLTEIKGRQLPQCSSCCED